MTLTVLLWLLCLNFKGGAPVSTAKHEFQGRGISCKGGTRVSTAGHEFEGGHEFKGRGMSFKGGISFKDIVHMQCRGFTECQSLWKCEIPLHLATHRFYRKQLRTWHCEEFRFFGTAESSQKGCERAKFLPKVRNSGTLAEERCQF